VPFERGQFAASTVVTGVDVGVLDEVFAGEEAEALVGGLEELELLSKYSYQGGAIRELDFRERHSTYLDLFFAAIDPAIPPAIASPIRKAKTTRAIVTDNPQTLLL